MPARAAPVPRDPGSVTLPTISPAYSTTRSKFAFRSGFPFPASSATSVSTAALSLRGFASFAVAAAAAACQ